ncbi:MAG: prephenate dehydrogenase/arogenate dehydrogenase family protein [Candidatus Woesearchaeota archaeon]
MKTLGIIGFGQMGRFIASKLKQDFFLFFFDTNNTIPEINGITKTTLEKTASCDIVLICVPIRKLEETLHLIKKWVKPGALICDICSVKEKPAEWMMNILPKDVELIGLHPLFGPQSAALSMSGKKIVFCPLRTTKENEIKKFLEKKELQVIITNPKEHDVSMAKTAVLSQFIGRALVEMDINPKEIDEPSFELLLQLKNMLKEDSEELFIDIQTKNEFAKENREKLMKELTKLQKRLGEIP